MWQVSGVAFDSYWIAPNTDGIGENIVYRFGSVGQVHDNMNSIINLLLVVVQPTRDYLSS